MSIWLHILFGLLLATSYSIAVYAKWLKYKEEEKKREEREKKKEEREKKKAEKEQKKLGNSAIKNGGGNTPKRYYIQHKIYMNTRR